MGRFKLEPFIALCTPRFAWSKAKARRRPVSVVAYRLPDVNTMRVVAAAFRSFSDTSSVIIGVAVFRPEPRMTSPGRSL
jgi:hypothetical protein